MMTTDLKRDAPSEFDFGECLWFLHRGYDECLYRIHDKKVIRAVRLPAAEVLFELSEIDHQLQWKILSPSAVTDKCRLQVKHFISEWFDLSRNLKPFYRQLRADQVLNHLGQDYHGLRLMRIPDLFEAICWCIIGQQINLHFAYKLKRRLVQKFGSSLMHEENVYWMFPRPVDLASANPKDLRAMQFSKQKIDYLLATAQNFVDGKLSIGHCLSIPDRIQRLEYLQSFRGIGPWTANYVMMKCMGDTRSVPYGDAGLLMALEKHKLIKHRKDRDAMASLFKHFAGYEAYLVLYLWRSLSNRPLAG